MGIPHSAVAPAIAATNKAYGADHPNATRIFYPNGDVDPWHGLSKLTASPGLPVLMVSGASHHAWTHPSAPTDQKSVVTTGDNPQAGGGVAQGRLKLKQATCIRVHVCHVTYVY